MSEFGLPKPVTVVIQTRKAIEKNVRDVVARSLSLAENTSHACKKVDISEPITLDLTKIIDEIKSEIIELNENSDERLSLKAFDEVILRSIDKYKDLPEKFSTLIIVSNPKDSETYFSQLTCIGSKLGFPDISENIKERILFGVLDLTKGNAKNTDHMKNVWARIVTKEQYEQMKFSEPTIVIKA